MLPAASRLSRRLLQGVSCCLSHHRGGSVGHRSLHLTACLPAEPLKKKKRVDPQVEQERIRKKTKRIEKEIKRLEQRGRYPKPLDEIEGERQFLKTLPSRVRDAAALPPEESELERRALLMKEWTRYKWAQLDSEGRLLGRQRREMYRAMEHLKQLDRGLFDAAAAPDASLIGLALSGPLFTPPLVAAPEEADDDDVDDEAAAFEAVDGDYKDVTPSYEYNFEMDKKMLFVKKKK